MYTLKVENARGSQMTLSHDESKYQILSVGGLNPPNAILYSSSVAGMDGTRFESSKLQERNIVLTIKINGDVERNRQTLYRFFRTKQYCKIYYSTASRSIYAEGYVETIECDLFSASEQMQISIVCHDPYLKDIEEIVYDLSQIVGNFEFPFAFGAGDDTDDPIEFSTIIRDRMVNVINNGDAASGFIVEMTALGSVTNPTIYCIDTGESFGVNCNLVAGDILIIDSIAGQKSVTLTRSGITSNYLRHIDRSSNWLKVQQGDNVFTYDADTGEDLIQVLFKFRTRYEAI